MLASLQDFNVDGRIGTVFDFSNLRDCSVRIVRALNREDRDAPIVDDVRDVPELEAGIEPRVVPAAKRIVDVVMVFREPPLQIAGVIGLARGCDGCEAAFLGKEVRSVD
jgi:hypothetical protein